MRLCNRQLLQINWDTQWNQKKNIQYNQKRKKETSVNGFYSLVDIFCHDNKNLKST